MDPARGLESDSIPRWPPVARRTRGGLVECVHHGAAVALDARGEILFAHGDPQARTFLRSAVKCWQALPLVESGAADRYRFTAQELALACASHEGEDAHVAVASSMLGKLGLDPAHLRCGAHPPYDRQAALALARRGEPPSNLHNNCSGKHAGMLAACLHRGWSIADYPEPSHPLQLEIRARIAAAAGLREEQLAHAIDGCGVPTWFLSLARMARMFSALGNAAADEPLGRLAQAMRAHPEMVAGGHIFDTRLAAATRGRVLAKRGGAALGCAATREGVGIAVKCGDGAGDVVPVLLMRVLAALGLLGVAEREALREFAAPAQRNVAGREVGVLEACF
jgi:L-asparaginase II